MNDLRDLIEDIEARVTSARDQLSAITMKGGRNGSSISNPQGAATQVEHALQALEEASRRIDWARMNGVVPR